MSSANDVGDLKHLVEDKKKELEEDEEEMYEKEEKSGTENKFDWNKWIPGANSRSH